VKRLLIRWAVIAVAVAVASAVVPGVTIHGGVGGVLIVAGIFGLVNAVLGPIAKLISLPLIVLTLGLFIFVVNAVMLGITAALTSRLDIHDFGAAMLAALVISAVSAVLNGFVRRREAERQLS
jgi:putative membrane protein